MRRTLRTMGQETSGNVNGHSHKILRAGFDASTSIQYGFASPTMFSRRGVLLSPTFEARMQIVHLASWSSEKNIGKANKKREGRTTADQVMTSW